MARCMKYDRWNDIPGLDVYFWFMHGLIKLIRRDGKKEIPSDSTGRYIPSWER